MANRSLRNKTSALLLATALTASWASAAPRGVAPAHANLFSRVWSFVVSLWGGSTKDPGATVHTDTGCHLDPDGRCAP